MRFILNNSAGIYYPEDFINGYFTFETKAPLNVDKIIVKLFGESRVQFLHSNKNGKNCRCSNVETIINKALYVWVQFGNQQLPARNHVFPLKFYLPKECPPTYSSDHGCINYTLKAEILSQNGIYKYCKTKIIVNKAFDLATNAMLMKPMSVSTLNLFIKPKISIPCGMIIIGQAIPLSIEVGNSSLDDIKEIEYGITQRTIYRKGCLNSRQGQNEKILYKVLWRKKMSFKVRVNSTRFTTQEIPSNVEFETINTQSICVEYFAFAKFFSKIRNKFEEVFLPVVFVRPPPKQTSRLPPPPYALINDAAIDYRNMPTSFLLSDSPPSYNEAVNLPREPQN